jgi:hypothetical protein
MGGKYNICIYEETCNETNGTVGTGRTVDHIYIKGKPKLFSGTNQKRYKKTDARFLKSIGW